jgi:hypothetical protein
MGLSVERLWNGRPRKQGSIVDTDSGVFTFFILSITDNRFATLKQRSTVNVRINGTLRRVLSTTVVVEKQKVLHIVSMCL